jgi:DNA ligase-1
LSPLKLNSQKRPINYNVGDALQPDDWFEARVVWEIQAADLSKSSVHRGGVGRLTNDTNRGIGLRFPRFLRDRPDKTPETATTSEQIVDLYYSQAGVTDTVIDGKDEEEDLNDDFI